MALTRDFRDTIKKRAMEDDAFRLGLLTESIECLLNDDIDTGKSLLRDYIKATIGFEKLAEETEMKPKSIMRFLSPSGNPTSRNLFGMIKTLQQREGVSLTVNVS